MEDKNKLIVSRRENALKVFPKSMSFIDGMNSSVCMEKYSRCKSPEDCMNTKSATLSELSEWYGEDCSKDWLYAQIATLNLFVNVSNHLQPYQAKEIAFWIYSQFTNLNIAEITLVISRIKLGKYGKLYNNLSGEFLLDCFSEYAKEKRSYLVKKEAETRNTYESVASFEIGIMKLLDNLPRVRDLMGKKVTEEEKKKIETEERNIQIEREKKRLFNEEWEKEKQKKK